MHKRNTTGLNPQAAAKGELRQCSIQLSPGDWALLDALVEKAKAHPQCSYTGRIGRGDIIHGLLLALSIQEELAIPIELVTIGVTEDGDGDCFACGGLEYHLRKGVDTPCPLCERNPTTTYTG